MILKAGNSFLPASLFSLARPRFPFILKINKIKTNYCCFLMSIHQHNQNIYEKVNFYSSDSIRLFTI